MNNKVKQQIIFGVIVLSVFSFLILRYINEIQKNSTEIVSGKGNLEFLSQQVDAVQKFKTNYASYKPDIEKINQFYVDSQNPAAFFSFLEKNAQECQIASEVFLSTNKDKSNEVAIFQITSRGDLLKVLKFLEKLETGPYLIKIQNLSIRSHSSNTDLGKPAVITDLVDVDFTIQVYIKPA